MVNKLKQRKSDGFTIIEVMIVLAIAGLIMLIVFRAVPALQRNSHNTSIKNDVASLLAGVNEYVNNNNGAAPTTVTGGTATSVDVGAAAGVNKVTVKLGYIDASTASNVTLAAAAGAVTNTKTAGQISIYTKATCNGNDIALGSSTRQIAAIYGLEGGAKICQES
jgi:prepilin-type N-terminal cleavage/methylation domain-containing protein